jgi:hypothetical protein
MVDQTINHFKTPYETFCKTRIGTPDRMRRLACYAGPEI